MLSSENIISYSTIGILIIWNIFNSVRDTKKGAIGEAADTISILQADSEVQRKEIQRLREENTGFKATVVEKDHQIQLFTGIFNGRGPEQEQFMKNMTEAVRGFQEYIRTNNERMEKILQTLTLLLERMQGVENNKNR